MSKITTSDFITRAIEVHGNLYNYSKVEYATMRTKICIIDNVYGEFYQSPMSHLSGSGHPERGKISSATKRKMGRDEFIKKSIKKHGTLYDYTKVQYINIDTPVCIFDPKYGEFWQSPWNHLHSNGCPERTKNNDTVYHTDHIVPLSIVKSSKRQHNKWVKTRPLYKFLDSNINKQTLYSIDNITKSDTILLNNVKYSASSFRNNYEVIHHLCLTLLNVDITSVIKEDKLYISALLKLSK